LGIPIKQDAGRIDAKAFRDGNTKELAVCITGCDTGFGRELAMELASRGFTVFAGCLNDNGRRQYMGYKNIIPLKMDVTKVADVTAAFETVQKWISNSSASMPRYLHAIVNNAGVSCMGTADWLDMSDYYNTMEVNFFGSVRTIKTFLPILKFQAIEKNHMEGRIIQIGSVGGLISGAGGSSYHASKFALEGFINSLRDELKVFDLCVVTINPSFHRSPMTDQIYFKCQNIWNKLPPETRNQYGEEYFQTLIHNSRRQTSLVTWDSKYVIHECVSALETLYPDSRIVVGLDGKYLFLPLSLLPDTVRDMATEIILKITGGTKVKPASMTKLHAGY